VLPLTAPILPADPAPAPPAVSVLMVSYNSGDYLVEAVLALARQSWRDFEVIVVDNGSADGAALRAAAAVSADPRFRFDFAGENLGFAAGNNRAAARARGRWLATLNPDAIAETDWLERLLAEAERHADVAALGSLQVDALHPDRLDGAGDEYFAPGLPWRSGFGQPVTALPAISEVFAPCAAAALYRADLFRAAGGFDERFFCFIEDVDLGFKLRLMGYRCLQLGSARVHHVGGASSGGNESVFVRYHCVRNMVWCFLQNMPGPLLAALLPAHLLILALIWWRGSGKGDRPVVARATRDAWKALLPTLRTRRRNQRLRRASSLAIARALCWSPLAFHHRRVLSRPAA